MMKNILPVLLLFIFNSVTAQSHITCDGERYRADVFEEVNSTIGLKYGEGTTVAGNFQELLMDVYEPANDEVENRPAIVLAFGGSFISGERGDLDWLCEAYARRGFVAVTIDYRIYDLPFFPLPTEADMESVVIGSVSDMKAAIRFLREDAATDNKFRIDPNLIFVGGISAGAITASHTAVLDSTDTFEPELWELIQSIGGIEGNSSDNFEYSSEVQGVVNFSGALRDASWIDAEDPPFVSIHDEFDGIVPYGGDFATVFGIEIAYLEGSQLIHHYADSLNIKNNLRTIEGSNGHVSYFGSQEEGESSFNFTSDFLFEIVCDETITGIFDTNTDVLTVEIFPNPTENILYLKSESDGMFRVTLYNALGQEFGYWEDVKQLHLSSFANGMYFIQIEDKESRKSVIEKVFVKN